MAMTFYRPSLLAFNGNKLTDHNRKELSVSPMRNQEIVTLANGSKRTFYRADKHSFSTSWDMVPAATAQTVDGLWGGQAIEDFFKTTFGPFTLTVVHNSVTRTYTVIFTDSGFSKSVIKRWQNTELWNVSIDLEEV